MATSRDFVASTSKHKRSTKQHTAARTKQRKKQPQAAQTSEVHSSSPLVRSSFALVCIDARTSRGVVGWTTSNKLSTRGVCAEQQHSCRRCSIDEGRRLNNDHNHNHTESTGVRTTKRRTVTVNKQRTRTRTRTNTHTHTNTHTNNDVRRSVELRSNQTAGLAGAAGASPLKTTNT